MTDDFTTARDLGEQLRIRREERKLTREELAALLGVSVWTIRAWEEGGNLEKVADYFRAVETLGFRIVVRDAIRGGCVNHAPPVLKFPRT